MTSRRTPSPFDPFDPEIRGCHCELCHELAATDARHGSAWREPSAALLAALTAGTHVHVSLDACPSPRSGGRGYTSSGGFMQSGLGIGMTPGGVTGARRD